MKKSISKYLLFIKKNSHFSRMRLNFYSKSKSIIMIKIKDSSRILFYYLLEIINITIFYLKNLFKKRNYFYIYKDYNNLLQNDNIGD